MRPSLKIKICGSFSSGFFIALAISTFAVPDKLGAQAMGIQKGDSVTIHYTLRVDSRVVDSSAGKNPYVYVQGSGQIIPGLEEQMEGLKKGDKKQVTVLPDKGYGPVNPDAFQNIPKKTLKNKKGLKLGSLVTGQFNGKTLRATVIGMSDKDVVLDLNHPYAGKTIQFDIEVVDIKKPVK